MPPEQVSGISHRVGPSADIYAMGIMLYEMLVGFHLIDLLNWHRCYCKSFKTTRIPKFYRSDIPRDLETICLKCIHRSPKERYITALDLAIDLELFLRNEPINSRPLSLVERMTRWAKHRPLLAATYLACFFMYGMHLIAKYALQLPFHQAEYDLIVTPVLLVWIASSWTFKSGLTVTQNMRLGFT